MKRWELSRRTVLRGAGTLVALPLLEQMVPSVARAQAAVGGPPVRLFVFYIPNGMVMSKWTPSATGALGELPPIMQALTPVKDDLLVLTNLANRPADLPSHLVAPHSSGTAAFLTATQPYMSGGSEVRNAISMDQVAASHVKQHTRFPSLEVGIDAAEGVGDCERTYACAYLRNISWSSPTTPMDKEVDPRSLFDRLFAGMGSRETAEQQAKRREYRQSVLDFVREDAQQLQSRLGAGDQRRLDEYLTGVRELEVRVAGLGSGQSCESGARPAAVVDIRDHTRAMLDIIVLALQCDLTRVVTFMLGNGRSKRTFPFLGLTGAHHNISHHGGRSDQLASLVKIQTWEVEQLAYVLQRMKAIPEAGATLLDNSAVYFASEVEDGNEHHYHNLPVLLAGRAGGRLSPGRHVRYETEQPVANLFISLLDIMGVQVATFGDDGTGPLPQLSA